MISRKPCHELLNHLCTWCVILNPVFQVINEKLGPVMSEGDIFSLVSNAQEFDQIKVRKNQGKSIFAKSAEGLKNGACVELFILISDSSS